MQRGVGEPEFLFVGAHDKGGRAQIFLEDFPILAAIGAFPIRAVGDETIQPLLHPVVGQFAHAAPRQLRRQMFHQNPLVRQTQLMLGVVAAQPAFDEQAVQHRRVDGAPVDLAPFQFGQLVADVA